MDESLQKYTIPDDAKSQILHLLWKNCERKADGNPDLNPYFENYYRTRTQRFSREGGIYICIRSHADALEVATQILQDATRDTISQLLSSRNHIDEQEEPLDMRPTPDTIDATIDLCAGLLLMCEFGIPQFGFSGSNPLPWPSNLTLRQATAEHFSPKNTKSLQPENPRIPRIFTAKNLVSIGGMKIRWTNNLVDHLLLSDDDQTVLVFHHVAFLQHHDSFKKGILPDGLASEALRTLALLFPTAGHKSRKWLETQATPNEPIDPLLTKLGTPRAHDRRFERFTFWHDRLVILKQAFDESSPRGWRQWWNDRRNSVQWYTFWVAIWVFVTASVFGFVQSVEGGLQVYLSWKGLQDGGTG
ncbi:hypothetical protein OQA88_5501 [Cercophora sp. LCS_1]